MNEVTRILEAIKRGDQAAAEELLPATYQELKRIAARLMAAEQDGHTLQPTALIHEAYMKLAGPDGILQSWDSRGHYFSAAAEAMRRILVDHARAKRTQKRGGNVAVLQIDEVDPPAGADVGALMADDVIAIDEALAALAKVDPAKAELVKLRYFAGLTIGEAAAALEISAATANRHWLYAKGWLGQEIEAARQRAAVEK